MLLAARRVSLVSQVADILRRALDDRRWTERLPAETELARQLQVSRMTLRAAVRILAEEKRLLVTNGQRTRIIAAAAGRARPVARVVGVISPLPIDVGPRFGSYYETYRAGMHAGGVRVDFHFGTRFYGRRPSRALAAFLRETKADLWILLASTVELQQWFQREGIPVILDGSCQPGIQLPALDIDYRAVCRHAVGRLTGLGHRRIVFLQNRFQAGGDLTSAAGFREACGGAGMQGQIVTCDDAVADVRRVLDRMFARPALAPTAILAQRWLPFTVLTYLGEKGRRVPGEVSLVSRDDLRNLERLVPEVARYRPNFDVYTQRLVRMTWAHFDDTLKPRQEFVLPDFIPGGSLGSPADAAD